MLRNCDGEDNPLRNSDDEQGDDDGHDYCDDDDYGDGDDDGDDEELDGNSARGARLSQTGLKDGRPTFFHVHKCLSVIVIIVTIVTS